ncbi:MAG: type 4a pilus biogenesis protein PilO [Proteobacteria bacterium]|nr:type 4a pilus biogenesis protein PilO [Pseudomonadota bacterium]MBU2228566.1 type 4a pilus biogenesis protein PilO [Pseudomonadota bacterium]MBU2261690.1 type 4a pilus biogenesis protein PilO [Pseudomonadota bacterium]
MALTLDDLKKLSPRNKALIICLAYILLSYLYYTAFLQDALAKGATLSAKLETLHQQVVEKERVVAQIDKFIREINELKEAFKVALLKLPNAREIPGLLASVAQSGRGAGLNFLLFEPVSPPPKPETKPATPPPAAAKGQPGKPAEPEKFYDEISVRVQLVGGFHNTLSFFEKVARIPRIINIEDINMGDAQEMKGRGRVIKTACTVKTYMFVERK